MLYAIKGIKYNSLFLSNRKTTLEALPLADVSIHFASLFMADVTSDSVLISRLLSWLQFLSRIWRSITPNTGASINVISKRNLANHQKTDVSCVTLSWHCALWPCMRRLALCDTRARYNESPRGLSQRSCKTGTSWVNCISTSASLVFAYRLCQAHTHTNTRIERENMWRTSNYVTTKAGIKGKQIMLLEVCHDQHISKQWVN